MPLIVGLAGFQGCGKSTVACYLENKYGFIRYSFAKPLKDVAKLIYSLSDEQLYGDLKNVVDPRYGITPRFIMQQLGTEVCRNIHKDTWVLAARNFIDDYDNHIHLLNKFVIDDCRFENEAMFIVYGYTTGLSRIFKIEGRKNKVIEGENHQSEKELPNHYIDSIIDNSGSYEYLTKQLDNLMAELNV